ncbi:UNVERIFIED_CONTAM: Retrovirus-related Pol polyprotein from transposon RE1 [Sesamum indicum]
MGSLRKRSIWISFTYVGEEQKVYHFYGLKQASRNWNIHFDEVIWGYDFIKNDFDPCIYKKVSGSSVAFLMLYVDDILLIGNDVKMLGIKIIWDISKRMLGMTQTSYIEKVLKRFKMENSKQGFLPMRHGFKLSKKQCPKTDEELKKMFDTPYALATTVKTILKYLRRTKDIFLVYGGGELILEGYNDTGFQSDEVDAKSQLGFDTTTDSTNQAEYIVALEADKKVVWMKNYIHDLGVVPSIVKSVVIFCDNNGAIAEVKEPRSHHTSKHILRRYHLLKEMVGRGDVQIDRVVESHQQKI